MVLLEYGCDLSKLLFSCLSSSPALPDPELIEDQQKFSSQTRHWPVLSIGCNAKRGTNFDSSSFRVASSSTLGRFLPVEDRISAPLPTEIESSISSLSAGLA